MTKKYNILQSGLILIAAFCLLTLTSECRAFFYRPAAAMSVFSEYEPFNDSAPAHTQVWKVVPEANPNGAVTLRFFPEKSAGADAVCELSLPPLGSAGEIRWQGIGGSGEKRSTTGLLLVSGFPAPCDILPVGERNEERVYQEKRAAGGSVFTKSYQVSFSRIGVAEAKEKGWIREEAASDSDLIMVTATDEKGKLAVRQLWSAGGSWWLYEETPVRRSWLIY